MDILLKPIVTEKMTNLGEDMNRYGFIVHKDANKIQIMQAIQELFNVHPVACRIMRVKRKPKRVRYQLGYTAEWKKAIVSLRAGETIQVFEGV